MPDPIDNNSPAAAILSGAPMPTNSAPQQPADAQARTAAAQQPAPQVNAPTQQQPLSALGSDSYGGKASQPQNPQQLSARHRALGMLAEKIFTGGHTEYSVDPQTGKTTSNFVKDSPGQIFRNLLGGALMGMAAGAPSTDKEGRTTYSDFASGAGRGASAVSEHLQAQDKERYDRAQEQFKNQREMQNANEEKTYRQAQIAQMNNTNLLAESELNLHTQEFVDGVNQRERTYQEHLEEIGAKPLPLNFGPNGEDVNGKIGNGKILQRQAGTNLDSVKAPEGYHTVHSFTTDMSGLSLKDGQWVDEQGKPVNLEDRTTHTLYALPDSIWNEDSGIRTGKELNDIAGFRVVDPDAKIHPTVGDVTAVKTKGAAMALENAKVQVDAMKARLEAANTRRQLEVAGKQLSFEQSRAMMAAYQSTKETIDSLKKQMDEESNMGHDVSDIREQLNDATEDLTEIRKQLFPNTVRPTKQPPPPSSQKMGKAPKPGTSASVDLLKQYLTANGGDKEKTRAAVLRDGWIIPQQGAR